MTLFDTAFRKLMRPVVVPLLRWLGNHELCRQFDRYASLEEAWTRCLMHLRHKAQVAAPGQALQCLVCYLQALPPNYWDDVAVGALTFGMRVVRSCSENDLRELANQRVLTRFFRSESTEVRTAVSALASLIPFSSIRFAIVTDLMEEAAVHRQIECALLQCHDMISNGLMDMSSLGVVRGWLETFATSESEAVRNAVVGVRLVLRRLDDFNRALAEIAQFHDRATQATRLKQFMRSLFGFDNTFLQKNIIPLLERFSEHRHVVTFIEEHDRRRADGPRQALTADASFTFSREREIVTVMGSGINVSARGFYGKFRSQLSPEQIGKLQVTIAGGKQFAGEVRVVHNNRPEQEAHDPDMPFYGGFRLTDDVTFPQPLLAG